MFTIVKLYVWQGITRIGRACKGKTLAEDIRLLRTKLKQQGIIVKTIQLSFRLVIIKRIKAKELLIFTRQLARLLKAGLPLVQILELLENSASNLLLKKLNQQLRISIQNGYSLTEALQQKKSYFSKLHIHLMALGEKTSNLDLMLMYISDDMEKNLKIKAKLTHVLFYPGLVIGVAIVVFFALLIGIVPQFEQLFTEVGAKLPLLTRLVISLSRFLESSLLFISLFFCLLWLLFSC